MVHEDRKKKSYCHNSWDIIHVLRSWVLHLGCIPSTKWIVSVFYCSSRDHIVSFFIHLHCYTHNLVGLKCSILTICVCVDNLYICMLYIYILMWSNAYTIHFYMHYMSRFAHIHTPQGPTMAPPHHRRRLPNSGVWWARWWYRRRSPVVGPDRGTVFVMITGWWFHIFFKSLPLPGEDSSNLTNIFPNGLVETTILDKFLPWLFCGRKIWGQPTHEQWVVL